MNIKITISPVHYSPNNGGGNGELYAEARFLRSTLFIPIDSEPAVAKLWFHLPWMEMEMPPPVSTFICTTVMLIPQIYPHFQSSLPYGLRNIIDI